MIYVGYPGVGKSTLAGKQFEFIDLECSQFTRTSILWYEHYVDVAEHIDRQGFNVFLSSHRNVRNELKRRNIKFITITPSLKLKDEWIERLYYRYEHSLKSKDLAAWHRAAKEFDNDVADLLNEENVKVIEAIPYRLSDILEI